MSAQPHSAPLHAGMADLNREVVALRQHIAWLHGALSRLGDLRPVASTIDLPVELTGRLDYARHTLAASLRRCAELGVHDRPPSLAALVLGQAFAAPPDERDEPAPHAGHPAKPGWAVAWCSFDGQITVSTHAPPDEVLLAEGHAHVLWHWIEELAVQGSGMLAGTWWVPHFTANASLQERAEAAMNFGHALAEAGRTVLPCTAPPFSLRDGRAPA